MFKVVKNGSNRLDLEFSGKLDSEGMKALLDELTSQSKDIESGRMLYRIENFTVPGFGALAVELSRLPELLRVMKKFDRVAVLTDKKMGSENQW